MTFVLSLTLSGIKIHSIVGFSHFIKDNLLKHSLLSIEQLLIFIFQSHPTYVDQPWDFGTFSPVDHSNFKDRLMLTKYHIFFTHVFLYID